VVNIYDYNSWMNYLHWGDSSLNTLSTYSRIKWCLWMKTLSFSWDNSRLFIFNLMYHQFFGSNTFWLIIIWVIMFLLCFVSLSICSSSIQTILQFMCLDVFVLFYFLYQNIKSSSRSCTCVLLGYGISQKGYRFYDPLSLHVSRYIIFLEHVPCFKVPQEISKFKKFEWI